MPDKTTPQMQNTPSIKHHFITAAITAGIILVVALFIWIPFKVIPALFSSGSKYVATTLSSTFVPATSTTVTTQNTSSGAAQTTQSASATSNNSNVSAPAAPNYYGLPDLAISFIATGIIDPSTGTFIQTPYAGADDTVAIRFEVKNIGTNVSGPWNMTLDMPSQTTPNYTSPYQESIRPGDAMIFTASFNSPIAQGINEAYITIDPSNLIAESNEMNNSITIPVNIEGTNYSNYYANTPAYSVPTTPGYGTLYTWTNINANCYANPQTLYPGGTVNWIVSASGGNGYFSYSWTGSDGLYSTSNEVSHTYYTPGSQVATVAVTSNGQTITAQCSAYVY